MTALVITLLSLAIGQVDATAADLVAGTLATPAPIPHGLPRTQLIAPEIPAETIELPATEVRVPQTGDFKRIEIGYVRPLSRELLPEWPWFADPRGGAIARVEFRSTGAAALRLKFRNIDTSNTVQIRIYSADGTTVFGPFTSPRRLQEGGWWTPTIFGDRIGVELYLPTESAWPLRTPEVTDVLYDYCRCALNPGSAASCHNDISCFPNWKNNDGRSVAALTFVSSSSCFLCTGALINRGPGDFDPLLLTATHCIGNQSEAESLEAWWLFVTDACNGVAPDPNTLPRNNGAKLLKKMASTDMTLVGLFDAPESDASPHFFAGWNSASWSSGEAATGVHHPSGDFKRISFGDTGGTSNRQFCDDNGQNCINADVRRVTWSDGITEGGSSGSPIFDENRQIRGTLTGGGSDCPSGEADDDDFYGRLDLAFDNLRYYISSGSIASPVFVDTAVAGDPGNDGSTEKGTAAEPFTGVYEATFAVIEGDIVKIEPGNYNEQFRVWRPMTLRRNGTSGVVRIGD